MSLRLRDSSKELDFATIDEFCEAIGMSEYDTRSREAVVWYLSRRQGPDGNAAFGLWRDDEGDYHADAEMVAYWNLRHERLARRARRSYAAAHPKTIAHDRAELTPEQRADLEAFHAEVAAERERSRAERIASRPVEPTIEPRKCTTCGKKPARLGDLCKRCAYAAGVMPKGKIGA